MLIQPIFLFTLGTKLVQTFELARKMDDTLAKNFAVAEPSTNNIMAPNASPQQSNQEMNSINYFSNDLIIPDSVTALNNQVNIDNLNRLPRELSFKELTNDTMINCKINSNTISEQITKALAGLTKFISGMVTRSAVGTPSTESVSEATDVTNSLTNTNAGEAATLVNSLGAMGQLSTASIPPKQMTPIISASCEHIPTGGITVSVVNPAIISEFSPGPVRLPIPIIRDITKDTVMFNAASNPIISELNALTNPKTFARNDVIISNNLASSTSMEGFQGSFIRRTLESLSSPKKIFAALTGIDTGDVGVRAKLSVTSSSPIAPTGISLLAENLLMDGKVAVMGNLPFSSALTVDGMLPNSGKGKVLYECGRGNVGIINESTTSSTNLATINSLSNMDFNNGLPVQNVVYNNNVYSRRTGVL